MIGGNQIKKVQTSNFTFHIIDIYAPKKTIQVVTCRHAINELKNINGSNC